MRYAVDTTHSILPVETWTPEDEIINRLKYLEMEISFLRNQMLAHEKATGGLKQIRNR